MSTTGSTRDGNTDAPANLFAITAKPSVLHLTAGSSSVVAFTVSYLGTAGADTSLPAHANLVPQDVDIGHWLTLDGTPGRHFAPNSTEVYTVQIAVPANAAPATTSFRLDMIGDKNPDEQYTQGPSVAVEMASATVAKTKPPVWLWIAIAAAVLVIGGALTFALTRGNSTPAPTLTPAPTPTSLPAATATPVPTPTLVPTPTPAPTATPSPTPDTTPVAMSGINFQPVDKNNARLTFTLSKPGTARVRYATSADLTNGTTVEATVTSGNAFVATLGVNRNTQYFYQITGTDRFGNSTSTLVKQFKILRTFTVALTRFTVKANHYVPAVLLLSSHECTPSYNYVETIQYASGTPSARIFTFTEPFAADVPKDSAIKHQEDFEEDPARAITLTVSGTAIPNLPPSSYGSLSCGGPLDPATTTLAPAEDWGVGKNDVTAESSDVQVTFAITDKLTPQFSA